MLPPTPEIRVMCKVIRWYRPRLYFLGRREWLDPYLRIALWCRWHFSVHYQIVQNKMFKYKFYLHSCRWRHGFSSLFSVECCLV